MSSASTTGRSHEQAPHGLKGFVHRRRRGAELVLLVLSLVVGIGASLGGPTGYAINPARDLGPRIVHAILPIKHKGGSDWGYAWVPVVGPLVGGAAVLGVRPMPVAVPAVWVSLRRQRRRFRAARS